MGRPRAHDQIHALAKRDGWRCAGCGAALHCGQCEPDGEGLPATRDHVIPRGKGGTDARWNLVLACEPCNHARGTETLSLTQQARNRARRGA